MASIFMELIYRVGLIIMLGLVFSRMKGFQTIITKKKLTLKEKVFAGVIFGVLSILGTITGIPYNGAIVNSRVVGVAVGGLLGGPVVGLVAGLLAGGHRFLSDVGGFTAVACGISTLLEGIIAGLLSKKFKMSENKIKFAWVVGFFLEMLQMLVVFIVARPFYDSINLIKVIIVPMTIINSIGIALFISIIINIMELTEIKSADKAKQALLIADKTIGHLKTGLTLTNAQSVANLIYESSDFQAVAITNREVGLAHIGEGSDHHVADMPISTKMTERVIESGQMEVAYEKATIGCSNKDCTLKYAIVCPLFDGRNVVGTLKLYKAYENISEADLELAKGISSLCSTQLKLSKLEEAHKLELTSEINVLQAQINPHFLFNTLNVIVSLIRTDASKAREVLVDLSEYFRKNMKSLSGVITLKEELKHVDTYIKICKARFGDKIEVVYSIEADESVQILPFLIQPLIENAIVHGILKNDDGGRVNLNIEREFDNLIILIKDNGPGVSQERLLELKNVSIETGIGLNNVIKRINNYYGRDSYIDISSKLGEGMSVKICLNVY